MEEKQDIRPIRPVLAVDRNAPQGPYEKKLHELVQLNRDAKKAKREYEEAIAETKHKK